MPLPIYWTHTLMRTGQKTQAKMLTVPVVALTDLRELLARCSHLISQLQVQDNPGSLLKTDARCLLADLEALRKETP